MKKEHAITIWEGCDPGFAKSIKEFENRWWSYSTTSRRYPIVRLIHEIIDSAVVAYMGTLPARYSGFVAGAGTETDFSEIIRLVGLDAMVRLQRELLRKFIKTVDREGSRDRRFIATVESLAALVWSCACKRPKKAALRGLNGTRSQGFCRFCGEPAGLKSFADDDSQVRGNDDRLRLSTQYCAGHKPQLPGGSPNPAYRRARRSIEQFDIELARLIRQCAQRGTLHAESDDLLVARYFYRYMLSQVTQPADKAELRNQARLMVDSKLTDRKKQIVVLQLEGFNQSQIARRLGIGRQAVSKALRSLASVPGMLQLKE